MKTTENKIGIEGSKRPSDGLENETGYHKGHCLNVEKREKVNDSLSLYIGQVLSYDKRGCICR